MAERRQQAGDPSDRAFPSGGVTLGADEMRALAHRAVDAIIHDLAEPAPIVRREPQAGLRARLDAPAPARGRGFDAALDQLFADVLPYRARYGSPGFLGFIPGYPNWVGALGDFIVSALNADAAWWVGAAGATQLELTVLGWFADWIGYPADASGILLGGGSAANLTALACARERRAGPMRDDLVVYVSSESHSSVARAARVLGFRPERVRVLPVDAAFRLSLPAFAATIDADRRRGLTPLAVCANAGTTNTGAVDPLGQLADLCGEADVWLHVDAAYGGFAVLTERGRRALAGIDRADSVALDPHKWLFQPVECGALLVREPDGLERAFAITPDYLRDITAQAGPNLSDRGLQLTRTSRAVKVWLSVQTFGLDAFRDAIDTAIDLARDAAAHVERSPALELLAPVDLGVVALRRHPPGEDDEERLAHLNEALVVEVERAANAIVSSTRLFGRTAIRLCVLNPTTTAADVARVLKVLEQAPVDLERAPAARSSGTSTSPASGTARPTPPRADPRRSRPRSPAHGTPWATHGRRARALARC
jgi:aromatic-L-amino-acid decarboxylase